MVIDTESSAASMLTLFSDVAAADAERLNIPESLRRWLFIDRLYARGQRKEMNFYGFDGPEHLGKFFRWISNFQYADYFPRDWRDALTQISVEQDTRCLQNFGLYVPPEGLRNVGMYNAQDYIAQRCYPTPPEQAPRRILDFGAGHGRMANLAFHAPDAVTELLVAVDGIPGPYLTQRVYYTGLGLDYVDYLDTAGTGADFDFMQAANEHQLVHIPTWRMDLLPANYFDLACCVQVLKELPRRLLCHVIATFARVLKPGGALYIRDHVQFHDPNQMPIDEILLASGFVLEFRPHVKDRVAIHGLPRIWRKFDPNLYLAADD